MIEKCNIYKVKTYEGGNRSRFSHPTFYENIKITTKNDIDLAQVYMKSQGNRISEYFTDDKE